MVFILPPMVAAQTPPPENINVVRQTSGTLAFRALSTGETRGEERFHIIAHPDGSRTVTAVSRYGPRDIVRHSLYRINRNGGAVSAALQYWIEGEWRASGQITVVGDSARVIGLSPSGLQEQTLEVTAPFAVLPHQLSPDSWRVMLYDKTLGGTQSIAMYDPDPLAESDDGLLGAMIKQDITYLGQSTVTVPAGSFLTDHFQISGAIDIFVTGPDAVLVKWRFPRIDREHVLLGIARGE